MYVSIRMCVCVHVCVYVCESVSVSVSVPVSVSLCVCLCLFASAASFWRLDLLLGICCISWEGGPRSTLCRPLADLCNVSVLSQQLRGSTNLMPIPLVSDWPVSS